MSPEGNTHAPIAGPTPAEALQVARADLQAKNEEIDRWNAIAATTSDPQTLIDARAHAEIAGRELPPLQEAADVAQLVLKDAEDTSTLDPILPSILQADAQVVDTLDAFTTAAGMVGWASTQRDRAAFGFVQQVGLIDNPRVSGRPPSLTMIDGYLLSASAPAVISAICGILAPVVRELGNGALADVLDAERAGGARLPQAREVAT